jgi:hypothetical protein
VRMSEAVVAVRRAAVGSEGPAGGCWEGGGFEVVIVAGLLLLVLPTLLLLAGSLGVVVLAAPLGRGDIDSSVTTMAGHFPCYLGRCETMAPDVVVGSPSVEWDRMEERRVTLLGVAVLRYTRIVL